MLGRGGALSYRLGERVAHRPARMFMFSSVFETPVTHKSAAAAPAAGYSAPIDHASTMLSNTKVTLKTFSQVGLCTVYG